MAGRAWIRKTTAFLVAIAVMFGLSFGNDRIINGTALAEEAVPVLSEEETGPQHTGEEAVPENTEEENNPQNAGEETAAPEENETETDPQRAGEETVPEDKDGKTEPKDSGKKDGTPEAEEAETLPQNTEEPVSPENPEDVPKTADTGKETVPQAAGDEDRAVDDKTVPGTGQKTGQEEAEAKQPEEPSVQEEKNAAEPAKNGDQAVHEENGAGKTGEEMTEAPADPEPYEEAAVVGTAEILLMNEGMLRYGDEIILKAEVRDVNVDYRLVWEANDNDDRGWFPVGSGEEYRFNLSRNNVKRAYRVFVIAA